MDFYFFIYFIICLYFIVGYKYKISASKYLLFPFFLIFLFGALRVDFGADYGAYERIFNNTHDFFNTSEERIELGYKYLNKILPSFRSLLFVTSFFTCYTLYYFFKSNIKNGYLIVFFILFFSNSLLITQLTGLRSAIACNIFIFSLYSLVNRKLHLYITFLLIGFLFHRSILFLFPLYFVVKPTVLSKFRSVLLILFLFILGIVTRFFNGLNGIINLLVGKYFSYYELYLENSLIDGTDSINIFVIFKWLLIAFFIWVTIFSIYKENDKKRICILKLALCFWCVSFFEHIGLAVRFFSYFAPFMIVGVTISTTKLSSIYKLFYVFSIILYFLIFFIRWTSLDRFIYFKEYHICF